MCIVAAICPVVDLSSQSVAYILMSLWKNQWRYLSLFEKVSQMNCILDCNWRIFPSSWLHKVTPVILSISISLIANWLFEAQFLIGTCIQQWTLTFNKQEILFLMRIYNYIFPYLMHRYICICKFVIIYQNCFTSRNYLLKN